ncbi:hypothetical protein SAMN04488029_2321 [Reichenbachiella faecimaris]|uniref:Uncharacterized protein n=1 Tax=Reichenbachiella faecimaris TaxID=692418 RepID=A0A1W2GEJ5_REIFA|nr:hypothetical protein [Reichenbachiella faecimaris]SMD35067.1 hypothetical protein SAMN04488029_2321 [Reichenbachiella faecimaris]
MNKIFKNRKVELTGMFAWSLLSFASINIAIQLFQNLLLSIGLTGLLCCFLNTFFLLAFYQYKLNTKKLFVFSSLFVSLIITYQMAFDFFVKINSPTKGFIISGIVGCSLIFMNMIAGIIIRMIANVKK